MSEQVEDTKTAAPEVRAKAKSRRANSHRKDQSARRSLLSMIAEYALTIAVALVVAVLIKTFLVQPFFIPSASMHPTLMENDKILVSKLHPGVLELHRGDVVVFSDPGNWVETNPNAPLSARQQVSQVLSWVGLAPDPHQNHLVKRLIGIGGDHIVCKEVGGQMEVNGVTLNETYIDPSNGACRWTFDVTVPKGKIWVMGDNRYNSGDSAYHNAMGQDGFVDASKVTGKAVLLFLPISRWSTLNQGEAVFAPVNNAAKASAAPAPALVH